MATPIKQPIRRATPWPRVNPWGNELSNRPSTNSPAQDMYPHLRSAARPEIPQPKEKK
jgi:hypothetical protein